MYTKLLQSVKFEPKNLRVKVARLNQKLTMPKRRVGGFLVRSELHSMSLREKTGSCHKRQKTHAPTPQAPIRNRQTRKVAKAKGLNRNTNLT